MDARPLTVNASSNQPFLIAHFAAAVFQIAAPQRRHGSRIEGALWSFDWLGGDPQHHIELAGLPRGVFSIQIHKSMVVLGLVWVSNSFNGTIC